MGFLTASQKLIQKAVKFTLPDGGVLIEDYDLKAISHMAVRLPYPVIVLEYNEPEHDGEGGELSTKRILIAEEWKETRDLTGAPDDVITSGIRIWPVSWLDGRKLWMGYNPVMLLDDKVEDNVIITPVKDASPMVGVKCIPQMIMSEMPFHASDYMNEVLALYTFLNALACKNVKIIKTNEAKPRGKEKDALGFDAYHILTLVVDRAPGDSTPKGGTHRSPREHLRRGHIRKLNSGGAIWVNSCLVNGGVGGKITKGYRLQKRG